MIKIVTDTDSNLPQAVVDEYGIELVPIHIIFGDEVVREHFEIQPAESYARMSAAAELPTTSQPPAGEFKIVYDRLLAEDPKVTILSIHISGDMSGTIASARAAAVDLPDADIRLFDTKSCSIGQALMVRQAAEMVRSGATPEAILDRLAQMRDEIKVYFVLNTLEYLAKGGRIGKASHLMGSMLQIKPVLGIEEGVISPHSKFRTWKKAVVGLRDMALEQAADSGDGALHMAVAYAVNYEEKDELVKTLRAELNPAELLVCEVGPGIGVHTGPGALGVCWVRVPEG
ncbi:MAG: DegV family protein [Anaerolineae bacterium]|nr:DegV family protein [Anaerolineae bacterium]